MCEADTVMVTEREGIVGGREEHIVGITCSKHIVLASADHLVRKWRPYEELNIPKRVALCQLWLPFQVSMGGATHCITANVVGGNVYKLLRN